MSIELPGWVADAFNLVGLPWPGIDEDQLRAWAGDLRAYATEITALSGSSRSAVAALAAADHSSFTRTLAAQWQQHHALISDLRGPMEVFAGALDVAADAVEAQKVVVIGAAVVLAGEVIATQAEALFTFGAAEAEVPAEVAIARLAVKAALQELEGQLLGMLINKAAAEISAHAGATIGKLVTGGGQVAAEAVTLTADYHAMTTLSGALSGHAGRVEQASSVSWRRSSGRTLEEGGPGGGWREVARAVEQAVLQVLRQLFVDLGRALWTIITDTIAFIKKAIAAFRHTDDTLAADAKTASGGAEGSLVAAGPPAGFGAGGSRPDLAKLGPAGADADAILKRHGTTIQYQTSGGSFYDPSTNEITIGPDTGDPGVSLVHEATHAKWANEGLSANIATLSRNDYISQALHEETDATVNQIRGNQVLQQADPKVPATAFQYEYEAGYQAAVQRAEQAAAAQGRALSAAEKAAAGNNGGWQAVNHGFTSGAAITSNSLESYTQYYGNAWDQYQALLQQQQGNNP